MRSLHTALVLLLLTIAYGCSNDSSTGSGGIGPGGGTGGGSITFQMTGQGDINSYTFGFKPSVDTKLSKLIAAVPNLQFFDTLTNQNTAYVFSKDTTYTLDPYQGVQTGQAWQFTFAGNIVSNNQAYTVTSNFTIP